MKLSVGLTGGIGCGKSTVANMLRELGALVVDTDVISHQLTGVGGAAISAIGSAFGEHYISAEGTLDRVMMRQVVFSDGRAKQQLEDIMHPLIFAEVREQLVSGGDYPYVVVVVPLLLTSPAYMQLIQRILVVDCEERLQVERVMRRTGMAEYEVRAIMAQQAGREKQLSKADDVIFNDDDLVSLAGKVKCLHANYSSWKSQMGD